MPLPDFLGPLKPLSTNLLTTGAHVALGGAGAPQVLPFMMQAQQEDNWCWAATTSSVSIYFNSESLWRQCTIASTCLSTACCASPGTCDRPYVLDHPLTVTGNLQGTALAGAEAIAEVVTQINNNRPICCHISWTAGGGHFVAIIGYDMATGDVFIADPLYGAETIPLAIFVSSYRGAGRWDFTYHTQP